MKKGVLIFTTFLAAVTLAGCQNKTAKKAVEKQNGIGTVKTTQDTSNSKETTINDSSSESRTTDTVWDVSKQAKLNIFFNSWAKTMKQTYEKYNGHDQIKTLAGEEFPKDFDNVAVNGQKATLAYHPNGKGDSDYNVVAIYNYNKGNPEQHITYFFAFHNNHPIVLVDQTTNGDMIQAKETENKDLINGFNSIAIGRDTSTSTTSSDSDSTTRSESPKLIGVFVGLLKSGDWFKDNLKNGHMYYGTDYDGGKVDGYDYITAGGGPTSYFWFKQNGDIVTIKYLDMSKTKDISHAPMKTEHISIERLKSDYYINSGQKSEVNGYVQALKLVSESND